jgi:ubiquinone/menaquinone biosynthesis C-methylase UbiE
MDTQPSLDLTHIQKRMLEVSGTEMHEATLNFYFSFLEREKNVIALDLGAGNGSVATRLSLLPQVSQVIAYDVNMGAMRLFDETTKLAKRCGGSNAALPFDDGMFDVVICRYTLHHLDQKVKTLEEIKRVLKRGGILLLSDAILPDHSQAVLSSIYRIREDNYHGYLTYYQLIALLEDGGFEPLLIRPYRYTYPSLTKYLEAVENGMSESFGAPPSKQEDTATAVAQVLKWKIRRAFASVDQQVQNEMRIVRNAETDDLSFQYFIVDIANRACR